MAVLLQPLYDELKSMDETLQLSKRQELAHICVANIEANAAHWQRGQKEI